MLDICSCEAEMLDFSNTAKSVALRIGPPFKHACAPLVLAGAYLEYVHQTEYLGMEFVIPGLFSQSRIPGLRNFQSRDPGIGNK